MRYLMRTQEVFVRTTVTIDEDLLKRAMEDTGIDEKSKLLN